MVPDRAEMCAVLFPVPQRTGSQAPPNTNTTAVSVPAAACTVEREIKRGLDGNSLTGVSMK